MALNRHQRANLQFILDEASGILEPIFEAMGRPINQVHHRARSFDTIVLKIATCCQQRCAGIG